MYEAPGVRLIAVVGVALQLIELSGTPLAVSKIGGVPVFVVQGEYGPRSAFWYQKPMLLGLSGWPGGWAGRGDRSAEGRAARELRGVGEERRRTRRDDVVVDRREDLVGVPLGGRGPQLCSVGFAFDEHWCTTWTSATRGSVPPVRPIWFCGFFR